MTPERAHPLPRTLRRYRTWEHQYLGEWLAQFRPGARALTHVHLGPIQPAMAREGLDAAELRGLGPWRRWADALVILPDRIEIIESKIMQTVGQTAQLQLYAALLPDTPELAEFRGRRIEMVAVVALSDPAATYQARQAGIQVVVWPPPWLSEWMAAGRPRDRRAPRWVLSSISSDGTHAK